MTWVAITAATWGLIGCIFLRAWKCGIHMPRDTRDCGDLPAVPAEFVRDHNRENTL